MADSVTTPRGMRDFLPVEKARREHALRVIREVYSAHGFDEIETPAMENSERLYGGLGGDNEKLAFAVMRRALSADDLAVAAASGDPLALADLGLRFDLTVPLARFYATHRGQLPPVFRSIHIGPVWRAERPQKGRYRQFVQCDIDIIGETSAIAEGELFAATSATLEALGLSGCTIRLNDRRVLSGILRGWGIPVEHSGRALISLDKLDKIGADKVAEELRELGTTRADVASDIAALAAADWDTVRAAPDWLDPTAAAHLLALHAAFPDIQLQFDPTLVRGMGYYTGTIFEIAHPEMGYSLGGGGRYDGMIGRFLGEDVPACGFSIGFERIVDLITLPDDQRSRAVVLVHDADVSVTTLLALKRSLIARGDRVRLERRVKNMRALLDRVTLEGFDVFSNVTSGSGDASTLEFRSLR